MVGETVTVRLFEDGYCFCHKTVTCIWLHWNRCRSYVYSDDDIGIATEVNPIVEGVADGDDWCPVAEDVADDNTTYLFLNIEWDPI